MINSITVSGKVIFIVRYTPVRHFYFSAVRSEKNIPEASQPDYISWLRLRAMEYE